MFMIYLQERDETNSASSSTRQNKVGTTYTTGLRRVKSRGLTNINGGITKSSGIQNEAMLIHERKETVSPHAKVHGSNIGGDRNNVQPKSQSSNICQKRKPKEETVPSATTDGKTERNYSFRYDRLSKFSSSRTKKDDGQKSSTSSPAVEEASGSVNVERKDATFRYDRMFSFKENMYSNGNSESDVLSTSTARKKERKRLPLPADKELATNKDTINKTAKDCFFKYGRLFRFSSEKHTDQNSSEVGTSDNVDCTNMKTKQKGRSVPSHKEEEPASYCDKTADSFRDDRLFTFNKKSTTVQNGHPNEKDELSGNSKVGDAKKKETVHQYKDKEFTTNTDEASKAGEKDSFKYDRLFNFNPRKQNCPDGTEEVYTTSSNVDDSYEYYSEDTGFSRSRGVLFF